jgi:iron complex transport system permease protein
MRDRTLAIRYLALVGVCVPLIAATALIGPASIGWDEVFADEGRVFWAYRVPRVTKAALAGAGLSVSGVILQALFRNPLATPYTLGIASGASLGAALALLTGFTGYWLWLPKLTAFAFVGAMAALGAVYMMSRLRAGRDMTLLLLAGVCVSYMCGAGVILITYLANKTITNDIVIWMMGSLEILRPAAAVEIAALLVPVMIYACISHRALDLMVMGDHLAASRGVSVPLTLWTSFVLVGALTAIIVANCGPIAFVGLMVPHMARAMLGVRTLPLVLGSALLGAAFLSVCDGIVRVFAQSPPVGVMTNIVGAIFFFYLLASGRSSSSVAGRS